jgi:hypothetical protein
MSTPIFKNYADALNHAQLQALAQCDEWVKENGGGDSCILIENTRPSDWLIKSSTCNCECGETESVVVTYFDPADNQWYGMAGICESCGKD